MRITLWPSFFGFLFLNFRVLTLCRFLGFVRKLFPFQKLYLLFLSLFLPAQTFFAFVFIVFIFTILCLRIIATLTKVWVKRVFARFTRFALTVKVAVTFINIAKKPLIELLILLLRFANQGTHSQPTSTSLRQFFFLKHNWFSLLLQRLFVVFFLLVI